MTKKALILVDFEKEWIDPSSDHFVGDISDVLIRTNRLIDYARKNGDKIIFMKHIDLKSEDVFVENTESVQFIESLHREPSDIIVEKNKISPFYQTNLEAQLKDIEEIIVCGILTNLCVRSLIHDAYDRDFSITVITDCCVAFDDETQSFTFKDLSATREEIEFKKVAEFIQ